MPSPLLLDGRLYFVAGNTGILTVLDAKAGRPLLADERLPGLAQLNASPVAAAGRRYLVDRQGTTVVLATNRLNDPVDAAPAVVGTTLFLRVHKYLYAIEEPGR